MRRGPREKLEDSKKRHRRRILLMLGLERRVSKMGYQMEKDSKGLSLQR